MGRGNVQTGYAAIEPLDDGVRITVPVPRDHRWHAIGDLVVRGGALELRRLTFEPRPDGEPGPLARELVKSFPISTFAQLLNAESGANPRIREIVDGLVGTDVVDATTGRRRSRADLVELAHVTARYEELVGDPNVRSKRSALARELHLSESRTSDLLRAAREEGIRVGVFERTASGRLSDYGRTLLSEEDIR